LPPAGRGIGFQPVNQPTTGWKPIPQVLRGRTAPETTFYLGRITLDTSGDQGMSQWRKRLFAWMVNNARDASKYFGIPSDQVVEIGSRLEI
jgi:K+ transporter